ncbi:MAG: YqgE/AlgH family protein [Deltaproteobacteria bacterium]|nr:YqgE/AlgH family protein [Deltaproteobacteria bacterium]
MRPRQGNSAGALARLVALAAVAVLVWLVATALKAFCASEEPAADAPPAVALAAGKILVASRRLVDPNFSESVILLVEYGGEGAMGVVVNRPSDLELADALPKRDGLDARSDKLYVGGPVEPTRLIVLLRAKEPPEGAVRIFADVYLLMSRTGLETMLERGLPQHDIRAYAGYAGWGAGQLDAEIARKDWLVLPADVSTVFSSDPADLWKEILERASGQWVRAQSPTCIAISRSPRARRCSQR